MLILLGLAATRYYVEIVPLPPALQSYWLVIHVFVATLATGFFALGFGLSLLQLLQQRRETAIAGDKKTRLGSLVRLPDAVALENYAYRLIIIGFAAVVLLGMAFLIARTRLGLFVRGVTQNRPMASALGVNTARIDTYAFALGCGIAGLAGCALSQIGNVGPDLGQSYIVDAFMVVVLGGVGQLAGTVYAAMGLGLMNKLLEGVAGAVLAKIAVLVFIIVFIQKRPQGLFAMKGRSAEA